MVGVCVKYNFHKWDVCLDKLLRFVVISTHRDIVDVGVLCECRIIFLLYFYCRCVSNGVVYKGRCSLERRSAEKSYKMPRCEGI